MEDENLTFTDRRAVPSIRKNLKQDIMDEITWMIETETRSEIQQCLFSGDGLKANTELEILKARKLTEGFMQVEPLLVELLENFRDEMH